MEKFSEKKQSFPAGIRVGLFLISAATLAFEINLTRIFSVVQFYHFAFLIVSIALLGFGASGTILAIFPIADRFRAQPGKITRNLAFATSISMIITLLVINYLPFDSFALLLEPKQILILVLYYVILSAPFTFTGLVTGSMLAVYKHQVNLVYAINLFGSAIGCALALILPGFFSGEGIITACSLLALTAALPLNIFQYNKKFGTDRFRVIPLISLVIIFSILIIDLVFRVITGTGISYFQLRISPYKSLSYALQYPGAELIKQQWNAMSRVDIVSSPGIRSLPGLSYRYAGTFPSQDGLFIDADEMSPVIHPDTNLEFVPYLPGSIAYELRPDADVLIMEPRGGLDIITALASGSRNITAVGSNPLVIKHVSSIYSNPQITWQIESDRSYVRRSHEKFDVIILSLVSSFHPIRSGAYSLVEDYRYTQEAMVDVIDHLESYGLLIMTRWLQNPPSESLRAFATAYSALEMLGEDPKRSIIAFRGYNMMTIIVKKSAFSAAETQIVREFTADRAYDLVFMPGLNPNEINQFNILPEPIYYQAFNDFSNSSSREAFFNEYPYDIRPPSDDKPFFNHYFKWSQTRQLIAELGKTWQPFGGAGYFIVFGLLGISTMLAMLIIMLPMISLRKKQSKEPKPNLGRLSIASLMYFGLLGLAYLLVEIPLFQQFILYLGNPSYSISLVLFTLLLFSGIGSRLSHRIELRKALIGLVVMLAITPLLVSIIIRSTIGLNLPFRMLISFVVIAPIGLLMGIPFPGGVRWLDIELQQPALIPWVWAVNGSTSVIAAILAALLSLSFGFSWVFRLGAICYSVAWLTVYWADQILHQRQ